jgi:SAM-dependent methyltransferase
MMESYIECATGHEREMKDILEKAFGLLGKIKESKIDFSPSMMSVISDVFRKGDSSFWFNRLYLHYKRVIKPQMRLKRLTPLIRGKKILDFGCGDGLSSIALSDHDYDVRMTDVLDIRDRDAMSLRFQKMESQIVIPYPSNCVDTSIAFTVLHHIDPENHEKVLDELKRVSSRVIVEEDCYDIPHNIAGFRDAVKKDNMLQRFMKLSKAGRLRYLMMVDYVGNALVQGTPEMNIPFAFKEVKEWQKLFEVHGFSLKKSFFTEFQKGAFNRVPQVWFVFDRNTG